MEQTDIELHYDTPFWAQGSPTGNSAPPRVPQQAAPVHETAPPLVVSPPAAAPDPDVPTSGEWHEVMASRRVRGLVLVLSLLGAAAGLVLTVLTHAPLAIVATVVLAVLAIVIRTSLIAATPTVVKLEGSTLTVRRNGRTDSFALADPNRRIETLGLPDQPDWRLRLEAPDLHVVELSASHVDAVVLHGVVRAHRDVAAIKRREHEARLRR